MVTSTGIVQSIRNALIASVKVVAITGPRIYTDHPRIKRDAQTGQVDLEFPHAIIHLMGGQFRQRRIIARAVVNLYAYAETTLEATDLIDYMLEAIEDQGLCGEYTITFPVTDYNQVVDACFARVTLTQTSR